MSNSLGWFGDLVAQHVLLDGEPQPQRRVWSFASGFIGIVDDPIAETLVITFDADGSLAAVIAAVATNTSNIATNTSNIATNTSNIATNTSNIATNTGDIATLKDLTFEDFASNPVTLVASGQGRLNVVRGTVTAATLPAASASVGKSISVFCEGIASIVVSRAGADVIWQAGQLASVTSYTVSGACVFTCRDGATWLVSP
jgi:hypothetical protein